MKICPKCGSSDVQLITEKTRYVSNFDICDGFLGYICFGPIGILCGACGKSEKEHTVKYCKCQMCGLKYKL